MLNEKVLEYGGLLAAGYGLYQANRLHESEQEKARKRHLESIELAKKQHENDIKVVKQTYLLELFNSLEQHFQQLNADLIASSRESERDMFDQRNQSFQTVIVASSVMFSALSTLIVDGILPDGSSYFLQITYSLTSALSFAFLFLSMVLCIELVIRTSSFMYNRGKAHTRNLERAIRDTKTMMRELRGDSGNYGLQTNCEEKVEEEHINNDISNSNYKNNHKINGTLYENNNMTYNQQPHHHLQRENSGVESIFSTTTATNNNINTSTTMMRRIISNMNPQQIDEEFEKHELQIRKYLKNREKLNDPNKSKAFRDFWIETCSAWWVYAILLFYAGSLNLLLALMIFMWAKFVLDYNTMIGAIIAVALLGFVSVVGLVMVMIMRQTDQHLKKRERSLLNKEDLLPITSSYEDLSHLNVASTSNTAINNDKTYRNNNELPHHISNEILVSPSLLQQQQRPPLHPGLRNSQSDVLTTASVSTSTPPISIMIQENDNIRSTSKHQYDDNNNEYKTLSDIKSMKDIETSIDNIASQHRDIERGSIQSETTLDSSIIYKKLKQQHQQHNNLNIDINNPENVSRSHKILKSIGKSIRKLSTTPIGTPSQTPIQTPINEKKTHKPFFSSEEDQDNIITSPSSVPQVITSYNSNNNSNNNTIRNNDYSYLSSNSNNLNSLRTTPVVSIASRRNLYKINSTSTISSGDKNQSYYDYSVETNGITF